MPAAVADVHAARLLAGSAHRPPYKEAHSESEILRSPPWTTASLMLVVFLHGSSVLLLVLLFFCHRPTIAKLLAPLCAPLTVPVLPWHPTQLGTCCTPPRVHRYLLAPAHRAPAVYLPPVPASLFRSLRFRPAPAVGLVSFDVVLSLALRAPLVPCGGVRLVLHVSRSLVRLRLTM